MRINDHDCENFREKILLELITLIDYLYFTARPTAFGEDEDDMRMVSSDTTDFMWAGLVSRFPMTSVNPYKFKSQVCLVLAAKCSPSQRRGVSEAKLFSSKFRICIGNKYVLQIV